jgi:hypothetical protein
VRVEREKVCVEVGGFVSSREDAREGAGGRTRERVQEGGQARGCTSQDKREDAPVAPVMTSP